MGSKKKEAKEKPLEKMTSKELREVAMSTEGVTGAHGMNKAELISQIRKARGIEEPVSKKTNTGESGDFLPSYVSGAIPL